MGILLVCFSIIISGIIFSTYMTTRQYEYFTTAFFRSYAELAQLVELSDSLDQNYELLFELVDKEPTQGETIKQAYYQTYQSMLETAEQLKTSLHGTAYYKIVDITNMLLSFHQEVEALFTQYDSQQIKLYLQGEIRSANKVRGFIKSEIGTTMNLIVKQSQQLYTQFEEQKAQIRSNTVLITLLICAFCYTISVLIARSISNPVHRLIQRMEHFSIGNEFQPMQENIYSNYEINYLVASFNLMMRQTMEREELEQELYKQQMDNLTIKASLRTSELNMLQMQMNPHFLFNTLNSIHALAQIEGVPRISAMTENLANILRYSLRGANHFATLQEELKIVYSYIYIQKVRLGDRIKFDFDLDESILNCSIPSMIIQPLIENAILHGYTCGQTSGTVLLKVKDHNDCVLVTVQDDGCGIDAAQVKQIMTCSENIGGTEKSGVGLSNVIRRMNLIYGTGHITLHSTPTQGTTIELYITKIKKGLDAQ